MNAAECENGDDFCITRLSLLRGDPIRTDTSSQAPVSIIFGKFGNRTSRYQKVLKFGIFFLNGHRGRERTLHLNCIHLLPIRLCSLLQDRVQVNRSTGRYRREETQAEKHPRKPTHTHETQRRLRAKSLIRSTLVRRITKTTQHYRRAKTGTDGTEGTKKLIIPQAKPPRRSTRKTHMSHIARETPPPQEKSSDHPRPSMTSRCYRRSRRARCNRVHAAT